MFNKSTYNLKQILAKKCFCSLLHYFQFLDSNSERRNNVCDFYEFHNPQSDSGSIALQFSFLASSSLNLNSHFSKIQAQCSAYQQKKMLPPFLPHSTLHFFPFNFYERLS